MSDLRIMSFNIAGGHDNDEPGNAWSTSGRSGLACEIIKRVSPDLIGFQEVQWPNFATFGQHLEDYDSFVGPYSEKPPYVYNPIFWRRSQLQPLAQGGFWISETPEYYSGSWETASIRVATWVRFRHKSTGKTFLQVNTHLDHISEKARVKGARLLDCWLTSSAKQDELQLLLGDFNCNPWHPDVEDEAGAGSTFTNAIHQFFQTKAFFDSFFSAGLEDGARSNTYHGYEGAAYNLRDHHLAWRLDWILYRETQAGINVDKFQIVHDHDGDLYPSDHYPIFADITWV